MINFYKVILFSLLFILYIIFMLFPRNLFTEVLGGDNFGHIYINSILTIITLLIMSKKKFLLSLSIIFASTTLIEFLQLFTTRSFSYYDLFYNVIGIGVGVIFYKILLLIIKNSRVFYKKSFTKLF
jgi:hypothetical protein